MRVLVASIFLESGDTEAVRKNGENATVTKHGFESRWGHQFDFVEVFRERFPSRPREDGNP
jgi:hypothetical protein